MFCKAKINVSLIKLIICLSVFNERVSFYDINTWRSNLQNELIINSISSYTLYILGWLLSKLINNSLTTFLNLWSRSL